MNKYLICSVSEADISQAPKEVKILPVGNVSSQHGTFIVDEESFNLIKAKFKDRGIDIVIDYEHQTLQDVQAPAGGWIKDLSLKDGAIVAEVEWTDKAEEYLKNKEYRYLSPVVRVRKYDKKAIGIHSVALTNLPAIDGMFTIANKLDQEDEDEGEEDMDLREIALALGLAEDAGEDEIKEAIIKIIAEKEELKAKSEKNSGEEVVANKVICELLGVKEDAKTEDISAAIMALKAPKDTAYAEEFLALKAKMEKKESQEMVLTALKAGKIAPAQKEWAEEYALKDPTGFVAFTAKAPVVVPYDQIELEPLPKKTSGASSEEEMKICKMMGVSKEDLLKYGKEV